MLLTKKSETSDNYDVVFIFLLFIMFIEGKDQGSSTFNYFFLFIPGNLQFQSWCTLVSYAVFVLDLFVELLFVKNLI